MDEFPFSRNREPWKVLGKDGHVINELPGERRDVNPHRPTKDQFDEIPSVEGDELGKFFISQVHAIPLFVADKTGVVFFMTLLGMAFGTVIHLHAVPGIEFQTGDIFSPDVSADAREPVFLIPGEELALPMIPVACPAFHFTHVHMGDVGEIHTIRLFGIDQPGDFLFLGHIFLEKTHLFRMFSQRGFRIVVALHAGLQFWNARKAAVFPKTVAGQASFKLCLALCDFRVRMDGMIEMDGLHLFGVKGHGKENPSHKQCGQKSAQKVDQPALERMGDQVGIIGQDNFNQGFNPLGQGRFIRGAFMIFHGVHPLGKKGIFASKKGKQFLRIYLLI